MVVALAEVVAAADMVVVAVEDLADGFNIDKVRTLIDPVKLTLKTSSC